MNFIPLVDTKASQKAPAGRYAALSADKLRGGYYTAGPLAHWLCRWAIRGIGDRVLEPSAGDGSFVVAAAERLRFLGTPASAVSRQLIGVELVEAEAAAARVRLGPALGKRAPAVVVGGDFFDWLDTNGTLKFDAVVGNPPFIRYQSFPEPARSRAMAMLQAWGFRPNRLTNAWVPFVVASAEALREGGRLAMVIPAELLQVTYAAQLRAYLTERFRHVDVVTCNELFFEGAEQEVVLLLADGALAARTPGHACRVAVVEQATVASLLKTEPMSLLAGSEEKDVRGGLQEKWLKYFLNNQEIGLLRALRSHTRVVDLGDLAEVDVGIVTGANEWFVMRQSEAVARRVTRWTCRMASRSAHLRGAVLRNADWEALDEADERVRLLDLRSDAKGALTKAAAAYIADGEARNIHLGYKCSIRKPWWRVPSVWSPDAFILRQIHDFPRLVLNEADATATDTIHRVRSRGVDTSTLVAGSFTHLTAASAEVEGRSYGGGVLELEPTEAERLLMPDAAALSSALPLSEADRLIRAGRLSDLLAENDQLVLRNAIGLSASDCDVLRGAWDKMRGRRFSRSRAVRART